MKTPPLLSPGKGPSSRYSRTSQRSSGPEEQQNLPQRSPKPSSEAFGEPRVGRIQSPTADGRIESSSSHDDKSKAQPGERHARSDSTQRLADLRKRMDEQIVLQQQRRPSADLTQSSANPRNVTPLPSISTAADHTSPGGLRSQTTPFSPASAGGKTGSTESGKTITATIPEEIPESPAIRTPSYPFPPMTLGTPLNAGQRAVPAFHRPFTLLSPTVGRSPAEGNVPASGQGVIPGLGSPVARQQLLYSEALPPMDNPDFPTPSLYEITLILNSEPGLESWWTSLAQVMQDYYGAERVTLAVPGDATDLENVPWGQKATFDSADTMTNLTSQEIPQEAGLAKKPDKLGVSEKDRLGYKGEQTNKLRPLPGLESRPSLQSRHSFAGYVKRSDESLFGSHREGERLQRPQGPARAVSSVSIRDGTLFDDARRKNLPKTEDPEDTMVSSETEYFDAPESLVSCPARVFHVPQPLEKEKDPLITRSGIVRLLSRDKVVVLTREFTLQPETPLDPSRKGKAVPQGKDDKAREAGRGRLRSSSNLSTKSTRSAKRNAQSHSRHGSGTSSHSRGSDRMAYAEPKMQVYEEYEQTATSPWSQSPAPSPAARGDHDQNPFFQQASINEDAFIARDIPLQDYTQGLPFEAIGVDQAKTVLHIPLFRRQICSRGFKLHLARRPMSPSDPGFSSQGDNMGAATDHRTAPKPSPIAIISFLTSTVPYPSNLIQSLEDLSPHITASFAMAQQYSILERQTANISVRQLGNIHEMGGTFSTTSSSQLEAVIEQRDQLYSLTGDGDAPQSAGSSVASPGEHSGLLRVSNPGSAASTPAWSPSQVGFSTEPITTPSHRTNTEGVESYFRVRSPGPHPQSTGRVTSPRRPGSKMKSSDQEVSRSAPKSSRLPTLGANMGATFPTLQESPNPLPNTINRAQEPSRRSSGTALSPDIRDPSDRLTRLVLDFLPLQIFTAEPRTGNLTWVNSKFLTYRNQDTEQIFEDPWQSIFEADREEFHKGWSNALQNETQYSSQIRLKRYDDSADCRWFHFRAIAMLSSSGVAVHWLGTLTDIHKQHQAEAEAERERHLVQTEAKYRALANSSPLIVFAAEQGKGIIFANDQWEAFSGQKLPDAMHFGFISHIHPDDIASYKLPASRLTSKNAQSSPTASAGSDSGPLYTNPSTSDSSPSSERTAQVQSSLSAPETATGAAKEVIPALADLARKGLVKIQQDHKGKISYSAEIRLRSDDGHYRWHLVRLVQVDPINFGNGEASWYGTCTDINDLKMLEEKLNQTMESKSNFFSTMSHELRTPLNGIIGNIPFLLEGDLSQEQTSLLETMQGSAVNLLDLINNIMDLSKVEAGRMDISMHWFHLRSVIEDVNDTVAPKAIEKRLELNYLVDDDVPSMVKGDPFRIRQVLINLVSNAVKFTNFGGAFIRCGVRTDPNRRLEANEILLDFEVIDTGIGFNDEQAKLLFKKFSQIDGSNTKQHGGSGLGLMISRQLVELHGGELNASSIECVGSTFSFYVRLYIPTDGDRPASPPRPDSLSRMSTTSSVASRAPTMSPDPVKYLRGSEVESPAYNSSASSDPSVRSMSMHRSERSSLSSTVPSEGLPIKLSLPTERRQFSELASVEESASDTAPSLVVKTIPRPALEPAKRSSSSQQSIRPSLYSILVVCPTDQHRAAIKQHIKHVIPDNIPHSVTDCGDVEKAQNMISGDDPVLFSHIVLNLRQTEPIVAFLHLTLAAKSTLPTSLVIVTDHIQKRELVKLASSFDFARLELDKKVHIVYRPSKPSKFAIIFDPEQERDLSKDRNSSTAQEISDNFKVTAQLVKDTIGDRGYRILVVEDNKTNLEVMLRYLTKVHLLVEVAQHGLECTNLVFAQEANYYSLILCDLKMPIKDGFSTVRDIRIWEASKHYNPIPIIALSANAMPEDTEHALKAGFSAYFTKPVNFPEFGRVLMGLLTHRMPYSGPGRKQEQRKGTPGTGVVLGSAASLVGL